MEWDAEPVSITTEEALRAAADDKRGSEDKAESDDCEEWLREVLAGGRVLSNSAVGDYNSRRFLNGARRLHFFHR